MISVLEELTENQLVEILSDTKSALIKQYQKLLWLEGGELEFTRDALHELAAQAIKKGTGARALRGLLERLMLDLMYEIPGSNDIEVEESFVPHHRCINFGAEYQLGPDFQGPLYRFPFIGMAAGGLTPVVLGIARRAIDEAAALGRGRLPQLAFSHGAPRHLLELSEELGDSQGRSA